MIDAKFKFERLDVWKEAMDLGEVLHLTTLSFPELEIYNLGSQLRRASDSVALNISEGSIGQTNPEQKRFIGYSIRSLAEVVTCLHKAKRREHVTETEFEELYERSYKLMNQLLAFRRAIR